MIWMLEEPYEDEQEDEGDSVDLEALIQSQSSLMGAIANHYRKHDRFDRPMAEGRRPPRTRRKPQDATPVARFIVQAQDESRLGEKGLRPL